MKQTKRRIPIAISVIVAVLVVCLLLLWLVGGVEGMQDLYLWIARFENSMRGIDGITEASRVKVMSDAARHFKVVVSICQVIVVCAILLVCFVGIKKIGQMNHKKNHRAK